VITLNLKQYRNKAGLTQKELAKLTGIAESTIAMIESGKRKPSWHSMNRISKVLGISVQILFFNGGNDEEPDRK
jgi:putative transcriptional regulator